MRQFGPEFRTFCSILSDIIRHNCFIEINTSLWSSALNSCSRFTVVVHTRCKIPSANISQWNSFYLLDILSKSIVYCYIDTQILPFLEKLRLCDVTDGRTHSDWTFWPWERSTCVIRVVDRIAPNRSEVVRIYSHKSPAVARIYR